MKSIFLMLLFCAVSASAQTVEEGITLFNRGDFANAEKVFAAILESDNKNVDAHIYLVRIYLGKGQFSRAERQIKKAMNDIKDDPRLYLERANLELKRPRRSTVQRKEAAERFFQRAAELDPANEDARYALFKAYFAEGDSAKAAATINDYIRDFPESIRGYLAAAELVKMNEYNILKRCDKIESYLYPAFELGTAVPGELVRLGWEFFVCDDLERAFQCYRSAIQELTDVNYKTYLDAGLIAAECFKYTDAIGYFRNGLASAPSDTLALLMSPGDVPVFLSEYLEKNFETSTEEFLDPQQMPKEREVFLRKLHHYALVWTRQRTRVDRKEPLEMSGHVTFTEPYLIHWGKHNYLNYAFNFLLNAVEQQKFQTLLSPDEMDEYRMQYFTRHDPTPGNGKSEILKEFEERLKYVYEEYKVQSDRFQENLHALDFTGYDDRGRVYLKYGQPHDFYFDSGGMKKMSYGWGRTEEELPPLFLDEMKMAPPTRALREKFSQDIISPFFQVIKPNLTWSYLDYHINLNFDFVELQEGYFVLVDNLDEAGYGGSQAWMLYLNRAYEGLMTGVYEYYLQAYDSQFFHANTPATFLSEYLIPDAVKKDEVVRKYPTNIKDVANPYQPMIINLDYATFKGEDGLTVLEIYSGIDYFNLKYERVSEQMLMSGIQYRVAMQDRDLNIVQQDTGLSVISFEPGTADKDQSFIRQFTLAEHPGSYRVTTTATNPQGMKQANYVRDIDLRTYLVDTLILSDIQLAYDVKPASERNIFVKHGLSVAPYPFRIVERDKPISIYFEIYNLEQRPGGGTSYEIVYTAEVVNPNVNLMNALKNLFSSKEQTASISMNVARSGSTPDAVEHTGFDLSALLPGDVILTVTVIDKVTGRSAQRSIKFRVY